MYFHDSPRMTFKDGKILTFSIHIPKIWKEQNLLVINMKLHDQYCDLW